MLLASLALAQDCNLDVPFDAPFEANVVVAGEGIHLVVELWVSGADIGGTEAMLAELEARGLVGTIVVDRTFAESKVSTVLKDWQKRGHRIVARFDPMAELGIPQSAVRLSVDDWWDTFRKTGRRIAKRSGKPPRAVAVSTLTRRGEAGSRQAGYPAMLEVQGAPGSTPRLLEPIEAYPGYGVLLPQGTYRGACGPSPVVTRFSPAALDRAAGALNAAIAVGPPGIVQLGVQVGGTTPEDAGTLGRWLDEVVLPSRVSVSDPVVFAAGVWEQLRPRGLGGSAQVVPDVEGGRLVSRQELHDAAASLLDVDMLPRTLPGQLTLAEAFLGWTSLLAGTVEGDLVRLGALEGPAAKANTVLSGPTEVSREAVVAMATALDGAMGDQVPAAIPVDGKLLTASELLLAFAGAVAGADPVQVRPVEPPEPHQAGLGWGKSGG